MTDIIFDTPILFIIFNRPDATQEVFNQIKKIKPKYLYVAADGPRQLKDNDYEKCLETRKIVQQIDWDCEIKTLFQDNNLGCGLAVSSAITWFFKNVEEGIILEDDCLPDLSFFYYCRELLKKYSNDGNIMHIGGNNFQNGILRGKGSYYFSNYNHIWGWATWKRAWNNYDYDMKDFLSAFNSGRLDHIYQTKNEKNYWKNVFLKTMQMRTNTWDYQWTYTIWKNNGFSITPNDNLVINLGFNEESTHNFLKDSYRDKIALKNIEFPLIHPQRAINYEADRYTFKTIFGYSITRITRLLMENGFSLVLKIFLKRIFK